MSREKTAPGRSSIARLRAIGLPALVCGAVLALALASLLASSGVTWAQAPATPPSASLDQILKEVASYDGGIESAALWKLRDYVRAREDDPAGRSECEAKLLRFLSSPATPAARMAAARHLRVLAGDSAVGSLQRMLADERVSDMALYALQQIPGASADKALVQSVSATTRSMKTAVIAALGERRVAAAVPLLASLLQHAEHGVPAATALGAIGDDQAARVLLEALPGASGQARTVIAAAALKCAQQAQARKDGPAALRVYEAVLSDAPLPLPLRRAATSGRISAGGERAAAILMEVLGGQDADLHEAAIARVGEVFAADRVEPLCAILPRLGEASQVQLLAALSTYPRERVLPALLAAAKGGPELVRVAALKALATAGDGTVVPFLLDLAASARGPLQLAARSTLGSIKGRDVDQAILALLATPPNEQAHVELLECAAERRMFAAKPLVAAALSSKDQRVRTRGLRALRVLGSPSDVPAVLDIVVSSQDDVERFEAEATASALARAVGNAGAGSRALRTRLATAKDKTARIRLLGVFARVGDPSSLPVLREALRDADEEVRVSAVRALTSWPTTAARDDVIGLVRESRDETTRLLAIDGLVRMVGLDRYRDPDAAVADLSLAAQVSWRPEEQRLVLGALSQFPCARALELAKGFLGEPSVKAEAQAAIEAISNRLK